MAGNGIREFGLHWKLLKKVIILLPKTLSPLSLIRVFALNWNTIGYGDKHLQH